MNGQQAYSLMLIEDSPEDREATMRALKKNGFNNPVICCVDGDDALNYLFRRGQYAPPVPTPRPGLILLDLNMPGTDGREVLAELKADADLRLIPVVVLTTSTNKLDIDGSYKAGASSYVTKPVDVHGFLRTIGTLKAWWFDEVLLPSFE
jgi:CheY-like chemotaxis protein